MNENFKKLLQQNEDIKYFIDRIKKDIMGKEIEKQIEIIDKLLRMLETFCLMLEIKDEENKIK